MPRTLQKEILDVVEQRAIYDTANKFPQLYVDSVALIHLLNHRAWEGGTIKDRDALRANGDAPNAKLFIVRLIIETEEIVEDHTSPERSQS